MTGETILMFGAGPCVVRFQVFPRDLRLCWLGKLMSDWQRSGNSKKVKARNWCPTLEASLINTIFKHPTILGLSV